ncbi:MAG TPA: transposase [Aestuariivirgaceae bacterium]|nr:transposase [Aestuariivirgaceae bacterium]
MARFYRAPDRSQRFLLPVDMMDWLPEGDIVHLIVDAVALMDLSEFEASHKLGGAGQPPFAPQVLLEVLIYAYSHGVRSSRAIERLCGRDAGYRFIVGEHVPDHTVIARFRRRHVGRLRGVFLHVLDLCREAGLIRLGLVVLDGTKVKASAALDGNRTAATIEEQIARMMAEAEASDAQEDRLFGAHRGDELPKDLARTGDRLARLQACKEKLERRAAEAAARQQEKIEGRAADEQASGRRKRGRKPKAPDPTVDPDAVANPTDPDSGIMKTWRGWVQGYNAQAVATPSQIILAADVTTEANDVQQLTGMLDQAQANIEAVMGEDALLGAAAADAGYWSEANAASQTEECDLFIATRKDHKQRADLRDAPAPRGRIPKGLSARGRMERKLRTKRGRAIYRQRGATIEPVFGQMKERQGADRFSMRGLELCRGEWHLQAAVHNLRKLHRESVRCAETGRSRRVIG